MSKLLDKILSNDNMSKAFKSVKANKGTDGVDEVTLDELSVYIKKNWKDIKSKKTGKKILPFTCKKITDTKAKWNKT